MRQQSNTPLAFMWWAGYTVLAVWAQKLLPGVDFLAPGFVLAMQERPGVRPLALALVWVLLQEGMGGLSFGFGIANYGLLALAYTMGRWMFEARSILFMCLLGLVLATLHVVLISGLLSLEAMQSLPDRLLLEAVMQAVAFPVVWWLAEYFFPQGLRTDAAPL